MNATKPNNEGIQTLRELGESHLYEIPSDAVLQAVASCGLIDLDKSIAAYHQAQRQAEETRTQVQGLEGTIAELREQVSTLEAQLKLLVEQETEFKYVMPLSDADDMFQVLFGLIREVQDAIRHARGSVNNQTGISFYQLLLLERFVLPALEDRLTPEWPADDIWATTINRQITQQLPQFQKNLTFWTDVLTDLKLKLSPARLNVLVSGICLSEQCDAAQLKNLIAQVREMAIAEKWFA